MAPPGLTAASTASWPRTGTAIGQTVPRERRCARRPLRSPAVQAMTGRVGVDTGGTFTDVVTTDGRVVKVPSTPTDPSAAVADGIARVGGATRLAHGTTVATNALVERSGARVALVTTEGFADLIEI